MLLRTGHNQRRAESQLLVLCKEVVGIGIQHHAAHRLKWEHILGPGLGHVHRVKVIPGVCRLLGGGLGLGVVGSGCEK